MNNFAIYDRVTGEIFSIIGAPDKTHVEIQLEVISGAGYIEVDTDVQNDTHYVITETDEIALKGDYQLSGLPVPCAITIEGAEYHCTEQPEFEFDAPGTYIITVDAGPRYLKKEFVIENTPLLA